MQEENEQIAAAERARIALMRRRREFEMACKDLIDPFVKSMIHCEAMFTTMIIKVNEKGEVQAERHERDELIRLKQNTQETCRMLCQSLLNTEFRDLLPEDGSQKEGS